MVDPRVERSKSQVLDAARDLLREVGFRGVTIEALASRSGVAKTTIYRHWGSAAEITVEAFAQVTHRTARVDTGSLREDLITILSGMAAIMHDREWIAAATSMMEAAMYDSDFKKLHNEFIRQSKIPIRESIERGIERGELPKDIDIPFLLARLSGPFFYQCLIAHEPMSSTKVPEVVDGALLNINR